MMKTPICDFVDKYIKSQAIRMHMPGHKGKSLLGFEERDITEITHADSLFEAKGIIAESEANAASLFGCNTYYSTEGSSLCIRAMLYLLKLRNKDITILAGRNAHKAFISAVALLDINVEWLYPNEEDSYLSGKISPESLEKAIEENKEKPLAVYITSPDYLGKIADIQEISKICKKRGIILCVDNAHGAYLRFLPKSLHPIDLGADICCDSAHKTLPVITGGAYLHISNDAPKLFSDNAKSALALFGSTSPSYLILQSLDKANLYMSSGYSQRLKSFLVKLKEIKSKIVEMGFELIGDEENKIVFKAKSFGLYGFEFQEYLESNGIFCEFADKDYLVLMLSPEIQDFELEKLLQVLKALSSVPRKKLVEEPPKIQKFEKVLSIREAIFSKSEYLPIEKCKGRILAEFNVGCPPAVAILVCGERIDEKAIECFEYYGIDKCKVVGV